MKRFCLFLFALAAAAAPITGAEALFTLGKHYERITPEQATETTGKIEVVEVFWYGCRHCHDFEPYLEAWLARKPEHVAFRRMPGIFAQNWIPHARAFFAAEVLGVVDQIHNPLFEAVHVQKRPLDDEASLAAFFAEQGVPKAEFRDAYNSFTVDSKVRQAIKLSRAYGITGVPSVIVNGKYRSSARLAGDFDDLLKVVDHLVDTEHGR